jgi:MFS superfamily sulfate permease-like transporter
MVKNLTGGFSQSPSIFGSLKNDFPASIVVFLVATPLCLGIALASGAPLFSGIIAGVVGGVVVGTISGSQIGVSGPAAGLAVIVLNAIISLGSWEIFLMAVVLSGVIQLILGFLRAGIIGYYFPSSVIKGMLSGIGIIIIIKQIPHALGYDIPENVIFNWQSVLAYIQPGAIIITAVALFILILWERPFFKNYKLFQWIQGPLVAVLSGIFLNQLFIFFVPSLAIETKFLVQIPVANSLTGFLGLFTFPDFSSLSNTAVYTTAFTLAVVASLETLLCVEATDKLDPYKRVTPTNLELKAQGFGNIISGFIGGLPITQVIVRSSANIQSGGKTKMAAILHGILLLFAAMLIPSVLNLIPLATLAAILFMVGYKLAKPSLFKQIYRLGWIQFIPFIITVGGIVFTDLLTGIALGMAVAIFYILRQNFRNPYFIAEDVVDVIHIKLSEDVSFLNRATIMKTLSEIPNNSNVIIDASYSSSIDYDVYEIIRDFEENSVHRNIQVTIKGLGRGMGTLISPNDSIDKIQRIIQKGIKQDLESVKSN